MAERQSMTTPEVVAKTLIDEHQGLKSAIQRVLGCPWQRWRCWSGSAEPSPRSPNSWRAPRRTYSPPQPHWRKLRSTNPLGRVNREIGRRSDVVGIFPNDASAIRLAGALLIEQNDEWLVSRRYLSAESIALVLEDQGDEGPKEVAAPKPREESRRVVTPLPAT